MNKPTAVLLCAGQGTRMNDQRTNKVCYEVAGVPAVIRTINGMREAGIERFVVVVGNKAEKVMECLRDVPGIAYAFQAERNGTGGAALCGLDALASFGYDGPVIIAMGDKIIDPSVYREMTDAYDAGAGRPVITVIPRAANPSGGRICMRGERVCGIYEMLDSALLYLAGVASKTEDGFRAAAEKLNINAKKKEKLVAAALGAAKLADRAVLSGESFGYEEIEAGDFVNAATYMVDCAAIRAALSGVSSLNAQNEIYLTDAFNKLIEESGASLVKVSDPSRILTYSTMDELLSLNKFFVDYNDDDLDLPFAGERLYELRSWGEEIREKFRAIYGADEELIAGRRDKICELLEAFIAKYGDRRVVISRSPGRVNLLGRHIEHRGGSINVMSINRETLLVASPRDDDTVQMANVDPSFPERSFGIIESLREFGREGEWIDYIENDATLNMILESRGDWSNYVKAAVLRLQMSDRKRTMRGMNMMFSGDIPPAAGLSSSSSIVVATSEAAIRINRMEVRAKEFIHLCGEGEWYVGSRGGSGDHAAIKFSKRDRITHIKFCPFEIGESVEFSGDYNVVVANSYVEAKKSEGARDKFNQKVACYEIGFLLIKKNNPAYAHKLKYLKDINPANLGVPQSTIYRLLSGIPEYMTRAQIFAALPEHKEEIERIMRSHAEPQRYGIRSTMLYGIAECMRAEKCLDLLKKGDYAALGALMNVSHNGDRVQHDGKPYDYSASDSYLMRLIDDLSSEDPVRVERAQIYNQPGGYACSTEVIDDLVDHIIARPGVAGAELSGAGLGGCIIVLVKKRSTDDLLKYLKEYYYDANDLPMGAQVFTPVSGSMAI